MGLRVYLGSCLIGAHVDWVPVFLLRSSSLTPSPSIQHLSIQYPTSFQTVHSSVMSLEAIKYTRGELQVLDQLRLPHESIYVSIKTSEDGHRAIHRMVVRGAPAIAIVAALSLAVELESLRDLSEFTPDSIHEHIKKALDYLNTSRPTAVNLSDAVTKLKAAVAKEVVRGGSTAQTVVAVYQDCAESMLEKDVADNKNIGKFGAEWLLKAVESGGKISVLTHCNTG